MKGIYVLLIQLDTTINIQAGKRRFYLDSGFYGYVGSALSGIEKRVGRHLSSEKRAYWHIDYLLDVAKVKDVICGETPESKECSLARKAKRVTCTAAIQNEIEVGFFEDPRSVSDIKRRPWAC
jgi:Uri superfamily endonuclease